MKILTLHAREYWERKLPRTRFHAIEALGRIAEVHNTGLGFDDWQDDRFVSENIDRIGFKPDWILVYKPDQYKGWAINTVPVAQAFNDCWETEARTNDIRLPNTRLAVMHHANEIPEWQGRFPGVRFVNIPYPVNPEVFYDRGEEKTVDILLTGAVDEKIYPLRYRFKKLIEDGAFAPYVAVHRKHSGYRLDDPESEAEAYAEDLGRARICLADTSCWGYAAEKYHEIPAVGSVLCGNMPEERKTRFRKFMLVIDPEWSDQVVVDYIKQWLSEPGMLGKRAAIGREYVHKHFTTDRYAERLVRAMGNASL